MRYFYIILIITYFTLNKKYEKELAQDFEIGHKINVQNEKYQRRILKHFCKNASVSVMLYFWNFG